MQREGKEHRQGGWRWGRARARARVSFSNFGSLVGFLWASSTIGLLYWLTPKTRTVGIYVITPEPSTLPDTVYTFVLTNIFSCLRCYP